jgi:OOP family OmpA-OmpF porin
MRGRLRGLCGAAVMAAALGAGPAQAVNTAQYEVPYFGAGVDGLLLDAARDAGDGLGLRLTLGVPMKSPENAIELRFFDAGYDRADGNQNFQTGVFVDYVRDFGPIMRGTAWYAGIKPFASAGVGFVQEDVNAAKHLHLALGLGGGAIVPLGWNGWAVRLDARAQPQVNNESVAGEDYLLDYVVGLGVQIPMTWFYERPTPAGDAACPLAVVNPETGRRDCVADTDGDGVADTADECPDTPAGAKVDAAGCLKVVRTRQDSDRDGDGVDDDDDKCPDTQRGLQVDRDGCVVAQRTAVEGVTFEPNSAKLTAQGRETLDGVAQTLRSQEGLAVEIAGHTDAVGSESFNTMLSQQRADAVRTYLVEKGIPAGRMKAVGYGELEPVASNDTDEGRKANRRVEFRISAD